MDLTIDKILVLGFSLTGIMFTGWFFLMKKEETVVVGGEEIDILVEGGYTPGSISIPVNKTTGINFTRRDSSSCLEEVVIPELKIRKFLPLNEKISIRIRPDKKGEFRFECGMNMFHGKIKVI